MIEKSFIIGKIYFVAFFCFVSLAIGINLLYHSIITQYLIAIVFLGSVFLGWLLIDKSRNTLRKTLLILIGGHIVGYLLLYYIRDISVDGNTYHAEAIINLFQGHSLFFDVSQSIWLQYYPKTIEILFAGFGSLYNNFDMGRIFKIFLIGISRINSIYLLKTLHKGKSSYRHIVLTSIIILNPVVLYQFFTLYIDDVLYLLLINFFIYVFLGESLIALLVFALLISSKVSYLLFGGLGSISMILINTTYYKTSITKTIQSLYANISKNLTITITILIIAGLVGCHQYLINTYIYHNPLYGFVGTGKKDIMSMFQPPVMREQNPIMKFFYTYFSYSRNYCIKDDCQSFISASDPDIIHHFVGSYEALQYWDPNINGFGNIYTILLIVALIGYIITLILRGPQQHKHLKAYLRVMIGYIIICTFLLPFPRARYFPLLYVLPLLLARSAHRRVSASIITLYCMNMIIVLIVVVNSYILNLISQIKHNKILTNLTTDTIYYTNLIPDSHFDTKFFSTYAYIIQNKTKKEISKQELLDLCGQEPTRTRGGVLSCQNGGNILQGEYSALHSLFYVK